MIGSMAELAFDKSTHRKLVTGDIEFERFSRYLRYASLNTFIHLAAVFWDKIVELLEDDSQDRATDWFFQNMTKEEVHWMLAHSGPGLSNTNCSSEVHWRVMKGAVLGAAGSSGAGYSLLRMQSNLTGFTVNESKQSLAEMTEKEQLVVFPSSAKYSKRVYDK